MRIEQRSLPAELRAADALKIGGLAVPYGRLSEDLGGFREQFVAGAFQATLADTSADVVLLWSHDRSKPLASRVGRTLSLQDAQDGLHFDASMTRTSWAADAHAAIAAGTVRTVSFGFTVPEGGDTWRRTGSEVIRTVHRAELLEISPVAFAAYQDTAVQARSIAEVLAAARIDPDLVQRDLLVQIIEFERMV
jgi:HK97 family phage prohead protease